jgi:hypothetical protein
MIVLKLSVVFWFFSESIIYSFRSTTKMSSLGLLMGRPSLQISHRVLLTLCMYSIMSAFL